MSRKRRRKQGKAGCQPTTASAVPGAKTTRTSRASQACTASNASKLAKTATGAVASGTGPAADSGAFVNPILAMGPLKKSFVALLLSLFAAFGPLCTDMYLPSLPDIAQDLDITTAFAQASITSCLLGFALGQLFIGPLSDGWGRKGLLLFSLAVFTASSLLCSYAADGWTFLALRFFMGVGGAGGAVLSRAISCDTYQGPDLTRFMSLLMAIHSVGPVLGPIVGGMVAGQAAEWDNMTRPVDQGLLEYISRGKTSALLIASVLSAGLLAGADEEKLRALEDYGLHAGLAFQIIDDVLDEEGDDAALGKPTGSDQERGLVTFASMLGCGDARRLAEEEAQTAVSALSVFGPEADTLRAFPPFFVTRSH